MVPAARSRSVSNPPNVGGISASFEARMHGESNVTSANSSFSIPFTAVPAERGHPQATNSSGADLTTEKFSRPQAMLSTDSVVTGTTIDTGAYSKEKEHATIDFAGSRDLHTPPIQGACATLSDSGGTESGHHSVLSSFAPNELSSRGYSPVQSKFEDLNVCDATSYIAQAASGSSLAASLAASSLRK